MAGKPGAGRHARPGPRLYIMGLNNPQDPDPAHALWPSPPGCAGHRLWRMVHDVSDVSIDWWLTSTQRVNLLNEPVLPRDYKSGARRRGEFLAPLLRDRTVLILGQDVANALGHGQAPFVWAKGRDWVMLPHPSGRNLIYNDPTYRLAAGTLIAELLRAMGFLGVD